MLSFLQRHHDIGHYSGYQTRVVAEYFYELTSPDALPKLAEIYQWTQDEQIPFLIIGGGTNLLFISDRFE